LVKWKGWSEEYDSWVAKEDLFCPDLVEEFSQRNSMTIAPPNEK